MLIRGSCHCGTLSFTLAWDPDPTEIVGRACGCSFCVKHGGVWTATPTGVLEVIVESAAAVSTYAFATRTAEFQICRRCGGVPLVTSLIDARRYAVVSVNAFDGVAPSLVRREPVSFDGEPEATRLARRQRGWIRTVSYRVRAP